MNDTFGIWYETSVGTIGISGLVLGACLPGPLVLKFLLILGGVGMVGLTFYAIFEALEIQCYRTFDDGGPGGGPDDGERVSDGVTSGPFRGKLNVYDFPRKAA